jgi:predicted XRE-type DNA-binding protein
LQSNRQHLLEFEAIEDLSERLAYFQKHKQEIAVEMRNPGHCMTPTQALVGEVKRFMKHNPNITQKELAAMLGCSKQQFCDLLHGRVNLSADKALALSRLVQITI